jgi:hypothetical protein
MEVRTPRQVIDQAVKENRLGERLLYGMAIGFAGIGGVLLIWAAANHSPTMAVVGCLSEILVWPSVESARKTRRESVAIRLLEAPLSRADTAREASDMLWKVYGELMLEAPVKKKRAKSITASK